VDTPKNNFDEELREILYQVRNYRSAQANHEFDRNCILISGAIRVIKQETKKLMPKEEELARKMHEWYLEATKKLHPESYNTNAQKSYDDLTDEQKEIDRYIAHHALSEWSKEMGVTL